MIPIELLAFSLPIAIAMIAVILEFILRTGWHGIIILSTLITLCFISAFAAVYVAWEYVMKTKLAKIKLRYIQKNAPFEFTHWKEDKLFIKFYGVNQPIVFIKKPLWLRLIEKVKFNGSYKDYPLLSSMICGVVGLIIGVVGGWMV